MPDLAEVEPKGVLRAGWTATVDDYAIAGRWTRRGEALVVGDAAGGLHAFEGRSGVPVWSHSNAHEGGLLSMSIHPDGRVLATGGQDGRTVLWSATDGSIDEAVNLGDGWVEHLAWSPDGRWLAASIARQVRVYRPDGTEVWRSEDHPSTVSAIAWSGAEELATACYGRVAFFGVPSGELRQKLEWKGSLVSMVLSPDGDVVACGSQDNSVHFWRRSTGEDSMMSGYPGKPSTLAFDASGTLLATSGAEAVTVWSFHNGGPEGTRPGILKLHVQSITTLAFARRKTRLASGARDGAVVVWSLKRDGTGKPVGVAMVGDIVAELRWRPDGRSLAALDRLGVVTVWRTGG